MRLMIVTLVAASTLAGCGQSEPTWRVVSVYSVSAGPGTPPKIDRAIVESGLKDRLTCEVVLATYRRAKALSIHQAFPVPAGAAESAKNDAEILAKTAEQEIKTARTLDQLAAGYEHAKQAIRDKTKADIQALNVEEDEELEKASWAMGCEREVRP